MAVYVVKVDLYVDGADDTDAWAKLIAAGEATRPYGRIAGR